MGSRAFESPGAVTQMRATSPQELAAQRLRELPEPEEIRPGIWTVPLQMPLGVSPTSFAYLIVDGDGRGHLVDTGWQTPGNKERLLQAYARAGVAASEIATVVSTHLHTDHLGAADDIRGGSGGELVMHRDEQRDIALMQDLTDVRAVDDLERWGVPEGERARLVEYLRKPSQLPYVKADTLIGDGDVIQLGDRQLEVLHTPGHTRGHICLAMLEERLLFSGDHVLPRIVPGLGLGARGTVNPLDDYVSTIERLSTYDDYEVCPGHGYRFFGLAARMEEIRTRHANRAGEITAALEEQPDASVWQVAERVSWRSGWDQLHTFLLISALNQTEMFITSEFRRNLSR